MSADDEENASNDHINNDVEVRDNSFDDEQSQDAYYSSLPSIIRSTVAIPIYVLNRPTAKILSTRMDNQIKKIHQEFLNIFGEGGLPLGYSDAAESFTTSNTNFF
jgi:hypothetical protein